MSVCTRLRALCLISLSLVSLDASAHPTELADAGPPALDGGSDLTPPFLKTGARLPP